MPRSQLGQHRPVTAPVACQEEENASDEEKEAEGDRTLFGGAAAGAGAGEGELEPSGTPPSDVHHGGPQMQAQDDAQHPDVEEIPRICMTYFGMTH